MRNNSENEVTVGQAADFLGVTTRTVLNYIQAKEIEAIKVGKSWYIKTPSLDAFAQRFNLGSKSTTPENKPPQAQQGFKENKAKRKRKNEDSSFSVKDLHAFKVATEIYLEIDSITALVKNETVQSKMQELYREAIEYIGAGYYSFEAHNKKQLYNKSRERVGGILSLIYAHQDEDFYQSPPAIIKKIEDDLLPAFSGLIRKMDNSSRKKKSNLEAKGHPSNE